MAPGFSLKLSPSKCLAIPLPSSHSPSSSHSGSPLRSPASSGFKESRDYFTAVGAAPPRQITQEEALKTVKAVEDVLGAWNEYRLKLNAAGKAGRKLAGALKDLSGHMEKTGVAAQTTSPATDMLDDTADVMIKLARKVDKTYDEVNGDASRYFGLLAKETRSHDAYLGAISKRHDKAEKAYKKASKDLVATSHAHASLLDLKNTLGDDITRANVEHTALLTAKQDDLLLRLASGSGALAEGVNSFFSEGLRKSAHGYRDLEYFRALADARWRGALPSDLDAEEEDRRRDAVRLAKLRVAMGDADVLGPDVFAAAQAHSADVKAVDTRPALAYPLSESKPYSSTSASASSHTSRMPPGPSVSLSNDVSQSGPGDGIASRIRTLPMTPNQLPVQIRHVSADPRCLPSHTRDSLVDPTGCSYPTMGPDRPLPSPAEYEPMRSGRRVTLPVQYDRA